MSFFKNGTVMVVIGTVIAAALMLMTNRDEPNVTSDTNQVAEIEKVAKVETNSSNVESEGVTPTETEKQEIKVSSENSEKSSSKAIEPVSETVAAAIALDGQFDNESEKTSDTVIDAELSNATVTDDSVAETDQNTQANKLVDSEVLDQAQQTAAPEGLYKKEKNETAITDATTQNNTEAPKSSDKSPIWLEQKLGEFQSVDTRDVEFIIMPNSADDLQGSNPKEVVTSKVGKFSPSAIPENYNYQQMPMYNGGYYIAPMPGYLMPSVLPKNSVE